MCCLLKCVAQLASALNHLGPAWRVSLTRETLVPNPDFFFRTEVLSVFTVISQALRAGEPLHPSSLLDRLLYHHARTISRSRSPEYEPKPRHKKSKPSIPEAKRGGCPDNRSRSQIPLQLRPKPKTSMMSAVSAAYTDVEEDTGIQEDVLGKVTSYEDCIQDVNFVNSASAVSAVRQIASASSKDWVYVPYGLTIYQCLDELHKVTKELCAEFPPKGFREWRGEYEHSFVRGV